MNLFFLHQKNEKTVFFNKNLKRRTFRFQQDVYRGFELKSIFMGKGTLFEWGQFGRTVDFRHGPETNILIQNRNLFQQTIILKVEYVSSEKVLASQKEIIPSGDTREILLPKYDFEEGVDLRISFALSKSFLPLGIRMRVLNSKVMNRTKFLNSLKGKVLEIGPGLNPQLRGTEVYYLEKHDPKSWFVSNKSGFKSVDWSKYYVSPAHSLPESISNLDVVFSCHVFEHLQNPLGHLLNWRKKLTRGGVIAGIVPSIFGAKDYFGVLSSLETLISEFELGRFEVPVEKYDYYCRIRNWNELSGKDLKKEDRSIHVHFYSIDNMSNLLDYCVSNLGFKSYEIEYEPNAKDFYFKLFV